MIVRVRVRTCACACVCARSPRPTQRACAGSRTVAHPHPRAHPRKRKQDACACPADHKGRRQPSRPWPRPGARPAHASPPRQLPPPSRHIQPIRSGAAPPAAPPRSGAVFPPRQRGWRARHGAASQAQVRRYRRGVRRHWDGVGRHRRGAWRHAACWMLRRGGSGLRPSLCDTAGGPGACFCVF